MKSQLLRYRTQILFVVVISLAVLALGMANQPPQKLAAEEQKSIAQTVIDSDNFRTLQKALENTRLLHTFKEDGPFTLFAPTDEAFARLPDELLFNLMRPESKTRLASILTYHTLPKKIMAHDVAARPNAQTVNGLFLTIRKKGKAIFVDSSKIIRTDIQCTNGVIHVIDTVLIPKQTQPL